MNNKDIDTFFSKILEDIDKIIENDFYIEKKNILVIKNKIQEWYVCYKKNKTLKKINVKDLEFIDKEINDLFDKYIISEPINENYIERLSYDFGHIKKYWKSENVRSV
ncbi:MAG: hypothetical protein IJ574_00900 [Bacilli bacterium]|nr:hypothetical protein [Bacilli bacterium]